MKRIVAIGISLGVVLTVSAAGAFAFSSHSTTSNTASTQAQIVTVPSSSEILALVNEERAKVGQPALKEDPRLTQSTQMKVDDMVKNNYLDHVNPTTGRHGYEYITDSGMSCHPGGENFAWGWGSQSSARALVDRWLNSPKHKEAMLSSQFTITGMSVGLMPDKKTVVAVEHFCK